MKRLISYTVLTALSATEAFADPGHLAQAGHGHSHWMGYGILIGMAAIAAGFALVRLASRKQTGKA